MCGHKPRGWPESTSPAIGTHCVPGEKEREEAHTFWSRVDTCLLASDWSFQRILP